ncbi:MAG: hypothetical protein BWY52_03247 [Chloroflexi bacterium ADurb.Bin325]|nr:MAG: hypothetical protein BWY52_03247 [Chloroflexi bacterium ADurb.Bin325]
MSPYAPSDFAATNLAIFRGQDPGRILWQPRLEFWYNVNHKRGTLPAHLKDATLLDLYDYCHASVRYFVNPLRHEFHDIEVRVDWPDEKSRRVVYETPVGRLQEVVHYDAWDLSAYHSEYRLKTAADFRVYEYMLQHETWRWDQEAYEQQIAAVGGRGAPQFYFRRSPVQGLFIENMGFEPTIYLMADQPAVIEQYCEIAAAADDALYDVLCAAPIDILNFGENIDHHMDPLIHESPFDGIEAATPIPQGDVTIDEIKAALGDKILLDGIPAVYFLPMYPLEELIDCTRRLVELFHPRLVLGISDEIPPDGDIERVRLIGELVQTW